MSATALPATKVARTVDLADPESTVADTGCQLSPAVRIVIVAKPDPNR
jgi:hypothetical protein